MNADELAEAVLTAIVAVVAYVVAYEITAAFAAAYFLFVYGVVLLVFRNAFGIELQNPFDLLPPDWRHRVPLLPYSK